jgi:penicillin-binding protein 2
MGLGELEASELQERILGIREDAAKRRSENPDAKKNSGRDMQQTLLKVDVARDVVAAVETHEAELVGIEVAPQPVRYYPFGELGAHIAGYMREIDSEDLVRLEDRDYRSGDRLGAIGVERRWESYLRGTRGWKKVVRGTRAQRNREEVEKKYLEPPRRLEPIPGRDVSLRGARGHRHRARLPRGLRTSSLSLVRSGVGSCRPATSRLTGRRFA